MALSKSEQFEGVTDIIRRLTQLRERMPDRPTTNLMIDSAQYTMSALRALITEENPTNEQ